MDNATIYISELIDTLNQELSAYKELLNVSVKKTDILVKGDVKTLSEITSVEQDMVLKLGKIEATRYSITKEFASLYKKQVSEINASFFESILPPEELKKFTDVFNELKKVLSELDQRNKTNEALIRRALDYIKFSMELITDAGKNTSVYNSKGKNSSEEALRLIDRKA